MPLLRSPIGPATERIRAGRLGRATPVHAGRRKKRESSAPTDRGHARGRTDAWLAPRWHEAAPVETCETCFGRSAGSRRGQRGPCPSAKPQRPVSRCWQGGRTACCTSRDAGGMWASAWQPREPVPAIEHRYRCVAASDNSSCRPSDDPAPRFDHLGQPSTGRRFERWTTAQLGIEGMPSPVDWPSAGPNQW